MTLLAEVGGRIAVSALVDLLFGDATGPRHVLRDPTLAPQFTGVDLGKHRAPVTNTLVALLDAPAGPLDDTRRGWLTAEHTGHGITAEHVDRLGRLIVLGLEDLGAGPGLIADVVAQLTPALDAVSVAGP